MERIADFLIYRNGVLYFIEFEPKFLSASIFLVLHFLSNFTSYVRRMNYILKWTSRREISFRKLEYRIRSIDRHPFTLRYLCARLECPLVQSATGIFVSLKQRYVPIIKCYT